MSSKVRDALLVVDKTWDGRPVPEAQWAQLRLALEPDALVIQIDAPYRGDPPPPGNPGPTDGLWAYEVVELFVVAEGERYLEVELSPHGHHWVLRLEGVRNKVEQGIGIAFAPSIVGGRWHGEARVPISAVPAGAVRCNAFHIAGVGDERSFHAWAPVPGPKPDFHRLEHFGAWPFR